MITIRKVPDTAYYGVDASAGHEWIMRPSIGRSYAVSHGASQSGFIWFCTREGELLIYNVATKKLVARLPYAIEARKGHDRVSGVEYRALSPTDGRHVFVLRRNGVVSRDLAVVSVDQQRVVKVMEELPGGLGLLTNPPVLDQENRILLSSSFQSDGIHSQGLLRIDADTGTIERSICDGSFANKMLQAPSALGRYWLRFDNSQLPIMKANKPRLGVFGQRPAVSEEFFGLCMEIWEAFPLQHRHTVVAMWLTADELPDKGGLDRERKIDTASGRMIGPDSKRRELYRKVSEMLGRDPKTTMGRLCLEPFKEEWPDEEYCNRNVWPNLFELETYRNVAGWQTDGEVVWLRLGGHLVCLGVDGTVSPRILLERYGYRSGTKVPAATNPIRFKATGNRCAELVYPDGVVNVSGEPSETTHQIRLISRSADRWRPREHDAQKKLDEKAIKKANAVARKRRTYRVSLVSLSESDCVSAITDLAGQIGPDLSDRVFDNTLLAVFACENKRFNEQKFFRHVSKNCPSAVEPIRLLIEAYCTHADPNLCAYWNPEKGIGTFGHAAYCLAKMDPDSSHLLRRYGRLIDTYHEYFFMGKTIPLMMKNLGPTSEKLEVAEWILFEKLGNCMRPPQAWKNFKIAATAEKLFSPREYAVRLLNTADASSTRARKNTEFGHAALDSVQKHLKPNMNAFETECFRALAELHAANAAGVR